MKGPLEEEHWILVDRFVTLNTDPDFDVCALQLLNSNDKVGKSEKNITTSS